MANGRRHGNRDTQFGPERREARAIDLDPSAGGLHQGARHTNAATQTPYTWPRPTKCQTRTKPLPRGSHPYRFETHGERGCACRSAPRGVSRDLGPGGAAKARSEPAFTSPDIVQIREPHLVRRSRREVPSQPVWGPRGSENGVAGKERRQWRVSPPNGDRFPEGDNRGGCRSCAPVAGLRPVHAGRQGA